MLRLGTSRWPRRRIIQSAVAVPGFVAYYPLQSNANDVSGNGYNLTNVGSVTFSGGGANFTGSNYLKSPNNVPLANNNVALTITGWFKTTGVGQGILAITNSLNGGGNYDQTFATNGSGELLSSFYTAWNSSTIGPVCNDGNWHFVAVSFDGVSELTSYFDSSTPFTTASGSVSGENSEPPQWFFGATINPVAASLVGSLKYFRFYNYALTATQIAEILASGQ